jgi:hypothetical protein
MLTRSILESQMQTSKNIAVNGKAATRSGVKKPLFLLLTLAVVVVEEEGVDDDDDDDEVVEEVVLAAVAAACFFLIPDEEGLGLLEDDGSVFAFLAAFFTSSVDFESILD